MASLWQKKQSVKARDHKLTASALCNNLSVAKGPGSHDCLAYTSKMKAVTLTGGISDGSAHTLKYELDTYVERERESVHLYMPITQTVQVVIDPAKPEDVLIVICGVFGAVVRTLDNFSVGQLILSEDHSAYLRGVCPGSGRLLCFGHASGDIWVSSLDSDGSSGGAKTSDGIPVLTPINTLKFHKSPVFSLHANASRDLMVSSEEDGFIALWKLPADTIGQPPIATSKKFDAPCITARLMDNGLVAASFQSGHIRLFHTGSLAPVAEIVGHSQCINALDTAHERILSAAEDGYARVWHVSKDGDRWKVEQEHYSFSEDSMFVGAAFNSNDATKFYLSTYDCSDIWCYQRDSK